MNESEHKDKSTFSPAGLDIETVSEIALIGQMSRQGLEGADGLIPKMADPRPEVADAALRAAASIWPLAGLPQRWPGDASVGADPAPEIPGWLIEGCRDWGPDGRLARRCLETLNELDSSGRELFLSRLADLLGFIEPMSQALERDRPDLVPLFQRKVRERLDLKFPPQINFAPTMACQLDCPYCVSAGLEAGLADEADWNEVRALLDWAESAGVRRIGLAGGEPTLYTRFTALLDEMARREMDLYLATNGLLSAGALESVLKAGPSSLTLHLTPRSQEDPHRGRFVKVARTLTGSGLPVALRINLTEPGLEVGPYFDLAQELGIDEIRAAVPIPNAGRQNIYVEIPDLDRFGVLIGELMAEGNRRGVVTRLCKPFPVCALPEEAARGLLASGDLALSCPVHFQDFTNNIIVWPDLTYSACMALSRPAESGLLRTRGPVEAAGSYRERIRDLMTTPLMGRCRGCPLWSRGSCVGACLSYRSPA